MFALKLLYLKFLIKFKKLNSFFNFNLINFININLKANNNFINHIDLYA